MTHAEAERAMILRAPVVYQDMTYERISGLIYRKKMENGGITVSTELLSACGHSVTIARLNRVGWLNPADQERSAPSAEPEEDEPVFQESRAKSAFSSGETVLYEEKIWIISALILRKWMDRPYWTSLELTGVSHRQVREVWSGSIVFAQAEKSC